LTDDGVPLPVDRVHNIENLLGMYEYNELDVLVNEAIANAVDAFRDHKIKSGKINITFTKKNSEVSYLSFHNNAPPMTKKQFYGKDGYHKVSFSSKRKGDGIGFAGVGAKLFLVSKQGGEIITVTGSGKNDFMASKMHKTIDDVKFKTTEKYPLKEILEIPNYSHTSGTTYSVRLTNYAYRYFKERLAGTIQYWWNYALLTKQIVVTIDGKPLSGWEPKGDKFKQSFKFKKQNIPTICYIAKETIPEERLHIVYTVFGKRIYNQQINLTRVKPDYAHRVFCIVDVSILANQLTSSKERFIKGIYTNDCRHQVEKNFGVFLEKHNLTTNSLLEPSRQMLKNELTNRLEALFKNKDTSFLDPFLTIKKQKIPTPNQDGDFTIAEIPGDGIGQGDGGQGDGGKPGTGQGTAYANDEDGNEVGKMKERRARGIHIIYDDTIKTHVDEAVVDPAAGAIIIDTTYPFWLRCKSNHVLSNFNEMRVVIEALMKYKNDELDWDVKKTLDQYRDLLHKVWI